jgi:3-hydroxyisobutyrate dehydrogenase-like beta-hydroxyacid dehydrogenase
MKPTIGIVGVGIMGGGIAEQLLRTGWPVIVWNRDRSKADRLGALGATVADTPAALAAGSDTIVIALRDDATLRDAVLGSGAILANARPNATLINVTTVTPGCAREVGAAVEATGRAFLDAPMTGSKAAAASGKLGLLVSGLPEVIERQRELLHTVAANITEFGAIGNSAAFKLANNQVAATLIRAIGESVALCEAAGLDRAMVVEALTGTASRVCGLKKEKLIHRDWSTDFTTDLMVKDLNQALATAGGLGVAMPLADTTRRIYASASAKGAAELDFAAVAEPEFH